MTVKAESRRSRVVELVRHPGTSFVPGRDLVHAWIEHAAPGPLRQRWEQLICQRALGTRLSFEHGEPLTHVQAQVYPFLPDAVLSAVLGPRQSPSAERKLSEDLTLHSQDAYFYRQGYGLFRELAMVRGWVAQPLMLGRYQSMFVGLGRNARLLSMNLHQGATAPMALAGTNKAYGRDILRSLGVPVPRGGLIGSVEDARARAEQLGFPVVIKRLYEGNSDGVVVGVADHTQLERICRRMLRVDRFLLIEEMLKGVELRLHFLAGQLGAVFESVPRRVIGDGRSNLIELLSIQHPEYWSQLRRLSVLKKRLLLQLSARGISGIEDLSRVVLREGEPLRVSSAGAGRM